MKKLFKVILFKIRSILGLESMLMLSEKQLIELQKNINFIKKRRYLLEA